jgi:glucose/arabinose dehydrogenase
MNSTWKVGRAGCVPIAIAAAILAPTGASVAAGPPPAPVGTAGHKVSLVARGIGSPTQIAFAHGRVLVAAAGDEKTGKGGGIWQIWHGKVSQISKTPLFGLVFTHNTLFASGKNKVMSSAWADGGLTSPKVIFQRPTSELQYLETMAVGPDGRLYMGSSDAGDAGAIGTPLSGRVLAIKRDGSGLEQIAKGLRQPFGIAFLQGDPSPVVGNESEGKSNPPDFIVHADKGSDFGFPKCQWTSPSASACAGKTPPAVRLRTHASPTGLVGRGSTIYAAFFGGTTKQGPEIRAYTAQGQVSKQLVKSALPLIGVGLNGSWLYFGDVSGAIYRVKV